MPTNTISRSAYLRARRIAGRHGHLWASLSSHPAVVAASSDALIDIALLDAAYDLAVAEADDRLGQHFCLHHTTGTGRLSWNVSSHETVLTVARPSLAWRVWDARRGLAADLAVDEPGLAEVLARELGAEPERGSHTVATLVVPAADAAPLQLACDPAHLGARHASTLVEALDALEPARLPELERLLHEAGVDSDLMLAAGIIASQQLNDTGRTISLGLWGHAALRVQLIATPTGLAYSDAAVEPGGAEDRVVLASAARWDPEFADRLADRLQSWGGMRPSAAHAAALRAFADAGLGVPAISDPEADPPVSTGGGPVVEVVTRRVNAEA